jgi:Mg2+ and Co2+ transporter CorA
MYLIFPDKSYHTLTYLMTIKEFDAQKNKEIANLKANADRFVATNEGYVTSGKIRNSVNNADSRRSYNEELIKAKAQVKYFQGFNKNTLYATDIKRWEDKVYQIEQDIKRLDSNAGN